MKKWTKLNVSKEKGGNGLKDLNEMNLALIAKNSWRLFHQPNSIYTKTMKGPNGETIGRKTRRARVQGKEEADCLAVSDALEWANQLNCKAFYLQGNNTRINKTLQGSARLTSWKTNSRMDQLLLLLSSLDVFICKNIKYKNVTSLQNLAKAGVRNPSPPI